MVSKCANPKCQAPFLYWHAGKLFRFEARNLPATKVRIDLRPPQGVEFFWLCEDCMQEFTLASDPVHGARVVPLQRQSFRAAS